MRDKILPLRTNSKVVDDICLGKEKVIEPLIYAII